MNRNQRNKGNQKTRQLIIQEAARLMYEDGIDQFHTAKFTAAKKILLGNSSQIRKTPSFLPSNGEIAQALDALADFHEGDSRTIRLFEMRILTLEVMQNLEPFFPRLIGSVSTGRIKKNSDIDLHIFTDDFEQLVNHIEKLRWYYEMQEVTILKSGKLASYTHIYLDQEFPVELSVYPLQELRVRGRSSTDGKPIIRLSPSKLLDLILMDHPAQWEKYLYQKETQPCNML